MNKQKLAILGSTGSIGTQVLEVVRQHPDKFEIVALTANGNWKLLAEQINELTPESALICNEDHYSKLKQAVNADTNLLSGIQNLVEIATHENCDTVLNSLVGFAGFVPTIEALKAGKKVALANKESLVVGGEIIRNILDEYSGTLVPVDSEHSAMLQSIVGEKHENIEKIVITASGGPFRDLNKDQMQNVTLSEALDHPNWDMGAKITVDSATMMNKGLEMIEAYYLFPVKKEQIDILVHPQSILHGMVNYSDGSSLAMLSLPDMKVPISYALSHANRMPIKKEKFDLAKIKTLDFFDIDDKKFPSLKLCKQALKEEGSAPIILNASNEIAVEKFLKKEIRFDEITKIVEQALNKMNNKAPKSIFEVLQIDEDVRRG